MAERSFLIHWRLAADSKGVTKVRAWRDGWAGDMFETFTQAEWQELVRLVDHPSLQRLFPISVQLHEEFED